MPVQIQQLIYRITLKTPFNTNPDHPQQPLQPGCVPIPEHTTTLLLRLTNADAEGLHRDTRVENEVSMLKLAFSALAPIKPFSLISRVDIQEFMPGSPLDESLPYMTPAQKKDIFVQVTAILKALRGFQVPDSIRGFGGVAFHREGEILSAPMTTGENGWCFERRGSEPIYSRVARKWNQGSSWCFVRDGLASRFGSLGLTNESVIAHLDFTPNNMLFDPTTHKITALLDWDFSAISHPVHEFLLSFSGFGVSLQGYSPSESIEDSSLRHAKIYGFPSSFSKSSVPGSENIAEDFEKGSRWEDLGAWEEALVHMDVKRPSTIQGVETVADVEALLGMVLPWRLGNGDASGRMSESAILKYRGEIEEGFGRCCCIWGIERAFYQ
ncbi:hypothetical protein BKA65DRAFT_560905 [Rhexocercosporidium sp. MPI-PUGE-AT-0058]|nr:hypothetical protein BKA65DRAFT_560905 [Rhexocercosporidium sp. MPI-PUGE-AT-0058]